MYLIYSRHFTKSPLRVAEALELTALERSAIGRRSWSEGAFNLDNTFFTYYPEPSQRMSAEYGAIHAFCVSNKLAQREALAAHGLPVPLSTGSTVPDRLARCRKFVTRPLFHTRGEGFRVTERAGDFTPGREYLQEWLPIAKEFRTLFCAGKPIVTMFKRNPNSEQESYELTRLDRLGFLDRLSTFPIIRHASLVGVDLALTEEGRGVVLEANLAPMLYQRNVERVVRVWAERRHASVD